MDARAGPPADENRVVPFVELKQGPPCSRCQGPAMGTIFVLQKWIYRQANITRPGKDAQMQVFSFFVITEPF